MISWPTVSYNLSPFDCWKFTFDNFVVSHKNLMMEVIFLTKNSAYMFQLLAQSVFFIFLSTTLISVNQKLAPFVKLTFPVSKQYFFV